jgi:hypothetical protein
MILREDVEHAYVGIIGQGKPLHNLNQKRLHSNYTIRTVSLFSSELGHFSKASATYPISSALFQCLANYIP